MTDLVLHGPDSGQPADEGEDSAFEELRRAVFSRLKQASTDEATAFGPGPGDRPAETGWSSVGQPVDVDTLIDRELDFYARRALRGEHRPLRPQSEARVRRRLHDWFTGSGALEALLTDSTIETININGCDNVWVLRRDGTKETVGRVAASDEELENMFRGMAADVTRRGGHERRFDRAEPELSLQLPNGGRLHALMDVTDRVSASIRLFPEPETLEDLVGKGEMTAPMAALFRALVNARINIVVSGGPGVGKTTLMCALGNAIPPQRRLILVEDTSELRFDRAKHPDQVRIQTRLPNTEGAGEFDMSRAVRASLRMTPDVVIVGEVRGAEVVWMAKAMSTGVDGSMCTVHAGDSAQTLLRMIAYAMEPPASYDRETAVAVLASAVHVIIHLDLANGTRVVSSMREVVGTDGKQILSNEVFAPGPDKRAIPAAPWRADTLDRLAATGFDPTVLHEIRW